MRFTAVVTSHGRSNGPLEIMTNLATQTRPPDEVVIFYSSTPLLVLPGSMPFPVRIGAELQDKKDWGHEKRDFGLQVANGDFVGFFNDDDIYSPEYIEKMMAAAEENDSGFVYCHWNINPCEPRGYSSTSGNFIVRRSVANSVGWTGRDYVADAHFIDGVVAKSIEWGRHVTLVPERLYWHNAL